MTNNSPNKDAYDDVFTSLEKHNKWFENSIPLIASENIPSPAVREAIISDFGNRYAEGWPGERVYAGCTYIDEVEIQCMDLAKRLFKAEFADVRPISGVVANLAVYSAFSNPGDVMIAPSIPAGGHISHGKKEHHGTAGFVHGLEIEFFAFDSDEMNLDVDKTKTKVEELKKQGRLPKIAMFGGSVFLFPHPVKELADFLKGYDIHINYDAAHVAGLIAGGEFQDPLSEGVDTMTMSTHKTLFGPQGGLVLAFEQNAGVIKKATFPGLTSSHHIHHMAAKAVTFAETLEFGKEYASQTIKNAKALAVALNDLGFKVLGEKKGFTQSHQAVVPGDIKAKRHYMHPGGIRLGSSEVTRLGMKESEMQQIASFIKQIIIDKKDAKEVSNQVIEFRKNYQKTEYCFDNKLGAYEYVKLR